MKRYGTFEVETNPQDRPNIVTVVRNYQQGGVLTPLLWTFVVDELLANLNRAGFSVEDYADGVTTSAVGDNPERLAL